METNFEYGNLTQESDYLRYVGTDLNNDLTALIINDVGDQPAPRFLFGIEDWLKNRLFTNFDNSVELLEEDTDTALTNDYLEKADLDSEDDLDDDQVTRLALIKKLFIRAVVAQSQYYLQNGTISNESGYDNATKMLIDRKLLEKISIAPDAQIFLYNAGLMNRRKY